ncbi:phage portal protein, partial [Escherichia coli]|uniref:phage portal protein n=1 Tax=Escherichia coli TaxID=562 RepID=UPI0032ED8BB0
KMLDTLQNTQLQSAIVKAMYAATIESELDTQSAMDFILGANSQEQRERLTGWIGEIAAYYAAAPVRLGGAKVPHLMPGDSLNLQTAQDTDNGYSVFEQSLLRYIAAGLGVSYEQLSRNYAQMSYSTARASANESWAYFMGRRKFVASRQASQMFLCWLEEAIVRRVVTLPSKARFSFQEARSAWGNCDWIGSGRMAIDGGRGHRSPRGDVTFKSALQLSGSPQCLGELRLDRLRSYGHRWSERSSGSGDADRSRTEHLRERVRETR